MNQAITGDPTPGSDRAAGILAGPDLSATRRDAAAVLAGHVALPGPCRKPAAARRPG